MTSADPAPDFPLVEYLSETLSARLMAYPLPELHGKKLFFTGATGFMGYWLLLAIRCLNREGADIRVHALSRNPDDFLARHPECRDMSWLSWTRGDARNYAMPDQRFDAVLHGAADTSPQAAANTEDLRDSIVGGTRRVLDHAAASGAKRILLLSSGAVYGEQPADLAHIDESFAFRDTPVDAKPDGYLTGKRIMETLAFAAGGKIEPVVARCFAFIGYGLPEHLAVGQFIRDAEESAAITVHGDGRPVRSFLYAADLAVWLLALLARGAARQAYNVGSAEAMSLAETAATVRNVLAPEKQVLIQGTRANSVRQRYVPDIGKAERELGLRVWTQFPEAVRLTARSRSSCRTQT